MAGTDDFLKSLGRNQLDTYRNSTEGMAEIDGVTGMDKTSAAFVRGLQKNFGSGGGDVGRAIVQAPSTVLGGVLGGAQSFGGGAYQALGDGLEMIGLENNWAQKQAAYNHAQVQAKQQAAAQNYQTSAGRDVGSGLYSAGATAPLTLASIASRNPAYMTGGAGVQTAADTYVADRQDGATVIPSLLNAIGQGSAEVLGEALPAQALVGMAARGINPGRVGSYALGELGGEAATGLVQDATGTAVHNNNSQGWQGFNERIPDTIQSSVIGGAVQGGVNLGMIPVTNAARDVVQSFQQQPQQPSTLNQANQAVSAANSTAAFMAKLDAGAAAQAQQPQPQPQASVQPQQQTPVNPKAQSSLMASLQEMTKPNSIFKTRTDVPTVQQLTGQQPNPQAPVKPQAEVSGNQAVQNTVNKIIGVESGGKANNPNPSSSANGLGQFIDSTWLAMVKRYRPDIANGKSRGQILALKTNPALGREMTVRYVEENARALSKAELPVTEGNLYLAHFSGAGTAIRAIKANPNTPASSVYGADAINANKSILQGKTIGQVVAWANRKMGSKAAANYQGDQAYVDDGGMATPVESSLADTSMFGDDSGNEAMLDAAQAQREAAEEMQDVVRKLGKQTTVRIGDEKAEADMMLIDALDLSPSVAGTENQYRDRSRAASQIQVNKIANELDPEILGDSKLIDTGAPTLAADGKTIIGGNGRTMGILQAYEQGNGQQYKDYIANHAAEFGINAADVLGMERPVLVRKLRSGDINVGKAAVASNENSGLAMSALEQARVDSGRLPNFGSLQFSDDGNLNIPANRNFIRDFVGQMPTTMQATMVDAQGNLSQDGYRRMQNAILHRAYGNTPALSRMVESSDQGTRNLLTAMMKSAPKIAAAKDAIKNGNMHDADIADDLVGAVETINQLRTEGRSVADYLAQHGMFAEDLSPVARELVAYLDDNIRSAKKISELIEAYYDVLAEQGSPNQDDIFGENAAPTKEKIYDTTKQQHNKRNAEPEQSGIFDQPTERSAEQSAGERTGEPSQESGQQPSSPERNGESTGESESEVSEPALFRRNPEPNQNIQSKITDIETAIQEAVGGLAQHIEVVSAYDMLPDDVAKSYIDGNAEGAYFPKDRKIYILAESVAPERARWVAWHELGHRGFDTPQFKNYQAVVTQARNNPIVDAVAKAIMKDRRQYTDDRAGTDINVATEEAIVELLAASKTGNYAEIEKRYGIKPIQPEFKTTLQRLLDKFKALMGKVTGRNVTEFSNEDVLDLLRAVEMAAAEDAQGGRDGEARLSRAEDNESIYNQAKEQGKTELTFEQWQQVRTPEFKKWFGDWEHDVVNASKIVNPKTGEPLVVYHSTNENFTEFNDAHFGKTDEGGAGRGFYFTENKSLSEEYGSNTIASFLNLKNPSVHDGFDSLYESVGVGQSRDLTGAKSLEIRKRIKAKGMDGIVIEDLSSEEGAANEYIVFEPNQIKSATDNAGTFNENNNDIRFSRKEEKRWFTEVGELSAGVAAYNYITDNLGPLLARVGFARSTPTFTKYMREYRAMLNASGTTAKEMAEQMKVMSDIDRKLLSDVIELEVPQGVAVPQELQDMADAIRAVFNQQSDDLVALDMLAPEAANRWRDTYLPRIYNKHADMFSDLGKIQAAFRKEMRKGMGNSIKGNHLKGRGIFKEVPTKQREYWESQGFEVREDKGDSKLLMWRDYTREERDQMNEERDAGLRFATGYVKTQADIAKGMLFKRVASDSELASNTKLSDNWVHVPDEAIAGTGGVKKYGALAGMYVHPEVFADLQRSFFMDNVAVKVWLKALGWWKMTKTVYNPVAHVNNVISNMVMYGMAGGRIRDLFPAWRSLMNKDVIYREALEQGLVGEYVDVAGIKEMFVGLNGMSDESIMEGIIMRTMKKADKLIGHFPQKVEAATSNKNKLVRDGGKLVANIQPSRLAQTAQDFYQAEDVVFKLGLYKLARNRGLGPRDAADYALAFMFDYTELPKSVRALRDTGILPFVSYTYKAIPAVARLALTRPHRVAAVSAAMYAFNAMSYFILGASGDEEDERKYMPEYQKGNSVFGTPKLLRLWFNDSNGDPLFIDVYRWLPLGDFADVNNQAGGAPLPNWMMPSGPAFNHYSALIMNKDTFTGRELVNDRMSGGEKSKIYAKWLAQQWVPSSVGVPFSYHTDNVLNGIKSQFEGNAFSDVLESMGYTGTNYRGEDAKLDRAAMGAFGVKVRGQPVEQQKQATMRRRKYEMSELKKDITRIKKDNTLTDSAKQSKIEARQEQLERLKAD